MIVSRLNAKRFALPKIDINAKVDNAKAIKVCAASVRRSELMIDVQAIFQQALARMPTGAALLSERWDRRALLSALKTLGRLQTLERETDETFVAYEFAQLKKTADGRNRLAAINVGGDLRALQAKTFFSRLQFWLDEIAKRNVSYEALVEVCKRRICKL